MVYACALVHGAPVYLQFTDDEDYGEFEHDFLYSIVRPQEYQGQDGTSCWLRPTSIDLVVKGARLNG